MDSEMEWTLETYRLDEIEGKFNFPCVVCVNEGYYSETDAEGFSQGDIMSIDSKMVLHKVAANFAEDIEEDTNLCDKDYVELEREILVPLNYKGKLKVLRHIKNYESARELAADFPRYAKVRENFKVTTEEKIPVTVQAGTDIELDRIIPGSTYGSIREPDKLVLQFQHKGGPLTVAVPLNARGKFRTVPDNNEYTIKEAIDRYSLPQHVSFVDDKIKRVYTQDLLEGIENMSTITETLRLNRLVTQNVLVGHYKPLDGSETKDTERFRQRTLVVLPIANPDICEIEVNVLKGVTDDVYEQVFLVRNVSNSNTEDFVDGSLYVDFAMTPGIKIISQDENTSYGEEEKPPPRPPKRGKVAPAIAPKPKSKWRQHKKPLADDTGISGGDDDGTYIVPESGIAPKPKSKLRQHKEATNVDSDDDGNDDIEDGLYIVPEAKEDQGKMPPSDTQSKESAKLYASNPHNMPETEDMYEEVSTSPTCKTLVHSNPLASGDYSGLSLADMDFAGLDCGKSNTLKKKLVSKLKSTIKDLRGPKEKTPARSVNESSVGKSALRTDLPTSHNEEQETPGLYEDINEAEMLDNPFQQFKKSSKDSGTYMRSIQYHEKCDKPTALVQPSNITHSDNRKQFKDLNNQELVGRLKLCGLPEIANFCDQENLNGSFFQHFTSETLKKEMNLKGIQLAKFLQMRDSNWVPT